MNASGETPLPPALLSRLASLRIGSVRYLNARPLIEPYSAPFGDTSLTPIRLEHPVVLAAALAAGELDVALVPIYEALRSPEDRLIDGVGICARGPVWSVYVAHREASPADIRELALDPASLTSANLVQLLFKESGRFPRLLPMAEVGPDTARLLIGDQANDFRREQGDTWHYLDLGEAWQRLTGLPFVFAAWVMRPEVAAPEETAEAFRALAALGRPMIPTIAASEPDPTFALRYLTEFIRYDLGWDEKCGVERYRELLIHHGQLPATLSDAPLRWV